MSVVTKGRDTNKIARKLIVLLLFIPMIGFSQQKDTLVKKLDSLGIKADTSKKGQVNNIQPEIYEDAKLDFGTYFTLLGDDIKQDILLPFHTKKKDWLKVGGLAVATAALALANRPVNRFAVKLHDDSKAVASISKYVTNFGGAYELYAIAGFYAYGLVFKTQKEKTTTALATQAYIIAGGMSFAAKYLAGEQRPYLTDPLTGRQGPIFHGLFYPFKKGLSSSDFSSFPSGHTTAAFAAATVYALEYKDKPLIPIISYSAATLIGLSRLTENKHWPVDVFVGAMLGYLNGKQVVNNFHRFSRLKHGKSTHEPISLNMQYYNKQIMSGLVYKF